jgi:hypothetical protein
MDAQTLASILAALATTFPDFVVYTTIDTDIVVIARKGGPPGPFQAEALQHAALAPLLQRLRLDPEVVRRRTIAKWGTLGPYFTGAYAMPANSDFFPVVEHRAARTRFTRDRVSDLVSLLGSPVPMLEMLDHGIAPPLARHGAALVTVPERAGAAAWTAYDIVMHADAPSAATFVEPIELSAQLVRVWASQCKSELGFTQVFSHMLAVAESVNPNLHPQAAGALWRRIADSACARALNPADRLWIELFAAVGARDAARMSEIGARVLDTQRDARGPAAEYAFMAAVTGSLKAGDVARARQLLAEGARSWLRPGEHVNEMSYLFNLARAAKPQ